MRTVAEVLPQTYVSVSCDLTKLHELTLRGNVDDVLRQMEANEKTEKGEYCIVMDFRQVPKADHAPVADVCLEAKLVDRMLAEDWSLREAAQTLIDAGEKKNAVKAASLRLKKLLLNGDD